MAEHRDRTLDRLRRGVARRRTSAGPACGNPRAGGRPRAAEAPSAPPAERALTDARLGIRGNELACYEALGIATVDDLLIHYSFRYHDFSATRGVRELLVGEEGAVSGVVVSVTAERWRGRMHGACKAEVRDACGDMLAVTWFNQPWLATRLPRGSGIALAGKVGFNGRRGEVTMANPEFYLFDAREEYRGRLVPVYRSTRGLSQTMLRRHIEKAIERYAEAIDEPLPGGLRARHKLIGRRQAVLEIHNPPNYAAARRAERRLAFDELLGVQLAVVRRKRRLAQAVLAPAIAEPDTVRGFLESLPFGLTAAQRRSLTEIEGEIASTTPMARLLQGDVGSGKTVVGPGGDAGLREQRQPGGAHGVDGGARGAALPHDRHLARHRPQPAPASGSPICRTCGGATPAPSCSPAPPAPASAARHSPRFATAAPGSSSARTA